MNTNTKWISTNYRHIMFFNDAFTFEVEAKKANISLGSLLEKPPIENGGVRLSLVAWGKYYGQFYEV